MESHIQNTREIGASFWSQCHAEKQKWIGRQTNQEVEIFI